MFNYFSKWKSFSLTTTWSDFLRMDKVVYTKASGVEAWGRWMDFVRFGGLKTVIYKC